MNEAILEATRRLLAEYGYEKMSIAAVAERAGATRPTIYRRWKSKEDLVVSAVSTLAATGPDTVPDDPWERLVAELKAMHKAISRPRGIALIGNVLALEEQRPELVKLYRRNVVGVRRSRLREALQQLRDHEDISPDVDIEMVINMMVGCYYAARVSGVAMDDDWPRWCVDLIRRGIEA